MSEDGFLTREEVAAYQELAEEAVGMAAAMDRMRELLDRFLSKVIESDELERVPMGIPVWASIFAADRSISEARETLAGLVKIVAHHGMLQRSMYLSSLDPVDRHREMREAEEEMEARNEDRRQRLIKQFESLGMAPFEVDGEALRNFLLVQGQWAGSSPPPDLGNI